MGLTSREENAESLKPEKLKAETGLTTDLTDGTDGMEEQIIRDIRSSAVFNTEDTENAEEISGCMKSFPFVPIRACHPKALRRMVNLSEVLPIQRFSICPPALCPLDSPL